MNILRISLISLILATGISAASAQNDPARQWPQFRGHLGSGILDEAGLPAAWNIKTGENILWKTDIPGLAHSCPVVWDNLIFVTSAVSSAAADSLKIGLYGDIDMADDQVSHQFRVFCVDRKTGKVIWDRIADEGVPRERRHIKSSHANPTPATDGKLLVVSFGSQGLFCYDFNGNLVWKKDLGSLATGPFNEEGVEWGYSSSPVIHNGKVVIQADLLKNSFVALLDLATGDEVWRVSRDAISSWCSPAICTEKGVTQIVLNAYPFVTAYDFNTGRELWKLGEVGDAPAPTPVVANGLIYVNSAHGKFSPIIAIRPDARGEITPKGDNIPTATQPMTIDPGGPVAWNFKRGGAYMASPVVYRGLLYNMQINGLLTVIDAITGAVKYKKDTGKAFSASGVASDGRVYFPAESGEVFVVEAGPEYKLLAGNSLEDICMASPAIAPGMLIFRTRHALVAVGTAAR
jgi:outer membrane protein assembly factor BamB